MALPVAAEISVAGQRECIGRTVARVCGEEGKLVLRVLRPGVDARPLPVEHLDRRRDGAGQPGVCARKGEVEFALIAARAEVEIEAVWLRRHPAPGPPPPPLPPRPPPPPPVSSPPPPLSPP